MPIPESSVLSPEIEILDPDWKNCIPAQRYLEAMVKYADGKIGKAELDLAGNAMVEFWAALDGKDEENIAKPYKTIKR